MQMLAKIRVSNRCTFSILFQNIHPKVLETILVKILDSSIFQLASNHYITNIKAITIYTYIISMLTCQQGCFMATFTLFLNL